MGVTNCIDGPGSRRPWIEGIGKEEIKSTERFKLLTSSQTLRRKDEYPFKKLSKCRAISA
jgi:hypothetical protein